MAWSEYLLSDSERAHLIGLEPQPGFQVLVKIMESEVEKFQVALLNTDPTKPDEVLAKHQLAKAAAMFWAGVASRLNHEKDLYVGQKQSKDVQPDLTQEMFG